MVGEGKVGKKRIKRGYSLVVVSIKSGKGADAIKMEEGNGTRTQKQILIIFPPLKKNGTLQTGLFSRFTWGLAINHHQYWTD
jgi:hypothetical protein